MVYSPEEIMNNLSNITETTTTTTNQSGRSYEKFYYDAQFITGIICYPIICICGIMGSVLILIVLSRKALHSSTNVYLRALAVSDLFKLLNDILYFLTVLLIHSDPPSGHKMYAYLYPWAHFFVHVPVLVSSWLTVSVAAERYILVCHPGRSRTLTTVSRARIVCMTCFIIMTLLAIPCAIRYRTVLKHEFINGKNVTTPDVELTELWQNYKFVLAYNWVLSLIRSIIPLIVLIILNAFIINTLRRTRANRRVAQRNKITVMLIIVTVTFSICITPDAVLSAFFNHGYRDAASYLVRGVREITDTLLALNAAVNFTIYIIFNKVFRDQFILVFCPGTTCHQYVEKDETYRRLSEGRSQANGMALSKKPSNMSTFSSQEHSTITGSIKGQTITAIKEHALGGSVKGPGVSNGQTFV